MIVAFVLALILACGFVVLLVCVFVYLIVLSFKRGPVTISHATVVEIEPEQGESPPDRPRRIVFP